MPYFQCRLASEDGQVFSESHFAPSQDSCRKHFESQGLCILSIKRDWKKIEVSFSMGRKDIKSKDFVMFNQELIALIKAGYPILKSIQIIINRAKDPRLREILMEVENEVRSGKSLSEAFDDCSVTFSTVYIASLMAGERGGNLPETINRYITYEKVISRTRERIKTALTYPVLLLLLSGALLAVLVGFIIPQFSDFYADFGAELPFITRALVAFSFFVRDNFPFLLGAVLLLAFVFVQMKRKPTTRILLDRWKLKIPIIRLVWIESAVALFSRTLSLLLGGGISLLQSVSIARKAVPNEYLVHRMHELPDYIKNGENLSDAVDKSDFFTPLALDMIRIGERSANLEGMLGEVASVYDERIQERVDRLVSLIEPAIIIIMGFIVAGMLLSVYLPIFNIISITR